MDLDLGAIVVAVIVGLIAPIVVDWSRALRDRRREAADKERHLRLAVKRLADAAGGSINAYYSRAGEAAMESASDELDQALEAIRPHEFDLSDDLRALLTSVRRRDTEATYAELIEELETACDRFLT